jgi:hypothetical protein
MISTLKTEIPQIIIMTDADVDGAPYKDTALGPSSSVLRGTWWRRDRYTFPSLLCTR